MGIYEARPITDMVLYGIGESRKKQKFVVRERKVQAAFRRLCFRAAPRVSGKTGTERVPWPSGVACPLGEDCSGKLPDFRRGLGFYICIHLYTNILKSSRQRIQPFGMTILILMTRDIEKLVYFIPPQSLPLFRANVYHRFRGNDYH